MGILKSTCSFPYRDLHMETVNSKMEKITSGDFFLNKDIDMTPNNKAFSKSAGSHHWFTWNIQLTSTRQVGALLTLLDPQPQEQL